MAIEVSQAVAAISDQLEAVVAVGLAVLVLMVGVHAWKWVRRALLSSDDGGARGSGDYFQDQHDATMDWWYSEGHSDYEVSSDGGAEAWEGPSLCPNCGNEGYHEFGECP